jgi:hypothetical protein
MNLYHNAYNHWRARLAPNMYRRSQMPGARCLLREQQAAGGAGIVASQRPIIMTLQRPQNALKNRQRMGVDWLVKFA